MLKCAGVDVLDIGVDVKPENFVNSLVETGASILGISVLLTFSINSIKKVVELLKEAGLRNQVTVIIGGYPVNEQIREYIGADYFVTDAVKAVELVKHITSEKR